MIVIYTQDNTIIRDEADTAREDLINLHGEKLRKEVYAAVKNGRAGMTYWKNGGSLVKAVSKEDAEIIRVKEDRGSEWESKLVSSNSKSCS